MLVAIVGACLLVGSCAPGPGTGGDGASPSNLEADRQAVIEAHLALVHAYEYGDAERFINGLDSSPELLIFHPRLHNRFGGIEQVRLDITRMFGRIGKARWTDVHQAVVVEGDTAWLTAQVVVESPNIDTFVGRATEIYRRRADGWRLAHAHWSANPEAGL